MTAPFLYQDRSKERELERLLPSLSQQVKMLNSTGVLFLSPTVLQVCLEHMFL